MGSYGMMGFGFGFGWLFMILFWGIIIWLAITLLNAASGRKDDALEILKKRYASGKISKNEYEEIKKELR
ncbi:SHOCT domain-containing protein [Candidatus Woesearchaeota archaeon]|nr:SHOCT domain-containing protein [Candidatus Woesearchaeota archaeon]